MKERTKRRTFGKIARKTKKKFKEKQKNVEKIDIERDRREIGRINS